MKDNHSKNRTKKQSLFMVFYLGMIKSIGAAPEIVKRMLLLTTSGVTIPTCDLVELWIYRDGTTLLIFLSRILRIKEVKSLSRVWLCDPMNRSLPGSSIHGIFKATVLEWVAISFSRGSSQPRDPTRVFRIVGRLFTAWATREVTRILLS